jgi:uncharacterized protein YhaN
VRLTNLRVDGYGVWSGLQVEGFGDGLSVLYGPNEAGKSTLLQFVRSMLYGFTPARRRYFPPQHGGRPGGEVAVVGPNGRYQLARHDDSSGQSPNGEQLVLSAADGTRQGEHFVKVLLSNVDETIFNNVFAVGLREMQELGTLSDTEAAALLYNLTVGLDRISLIEVMRELETSRNRILDRDGKPCQVVQLTAQREKLRAEIDELAAVSRRYGHLAAERSELDRELARLEEERNRTEHQARVVELAITLRERWLHRKGLEDQLTVLGSPQAMPPGVVERFDGLVGRLQKRQQEAQQLQSQAEQTRAEAAGLAVNDALWRQAARIEALQEQDTWLTGLQNQVDELELEIAELESSLGDEHKRLGLGDGKQSALPVVSPRTLATLRAPAKAVRGTRDRLREEQAAVATAEETVQTLTKQIDAGLAARGQQDLGAAMDRAGNLVGQLRRRVQIDERLDQMSRYQTELEDQSRSLLERQLLPLPVLAGLGAVFVIGVMLILVAVFRPGSVAGAFGWALAVLGLAGAAAAALGKILLERSNARQLDACQKQLTMLQTQIQQTKQDRDALDAQLPRGGGPIPSRLQSAEQELASLEELVPLDTRRTAARQEGEAAGRRAVQAEAELTAARRRWRDGLKGIGLPGNLVPKQVRHIVQRCEHIAQTQRRLVHRREELSQRRRELDALAGRIAQLGSDAGVTFVSKQPCERLRELGAGLGREEAVVARRDELRRQSRRIRRKLVRFDESIGRLKHCVREVLFEAGARSEQEFRHRILQATRAEGLLKERDALDREIAAAIGGHCPADAVREQIEGPGAEHVEIRRSQLRDRLAALQQQVRQRLEQRGQLAEQLRALSDDRQLALKQLELGTVEKRLEEAVRRWQVLAVTAQTLDDVRTSYEKDRQPETLREASGYLDRMTDGRYRRVWTPLGENVLRVDDADGHSLPVESLSRGTREQLFLSLRLAICAVYARRGAALPLVLDDVLVNFDASRAKAAATVLRDFAAAGHQVLVFTCHEHLMKLFASLKVPVGTLPDHHQENLPVIVLSQPAEKLPRAKKTPAAPRKPVKIKEPEPEEEEELLDDEPEPLEEPEPEERPARRPAAKKAKPPARPKKSKQKGVFDADFFDSDDEEQDRAEEEEAVEPEFEVEDIDFFSDEEDEDDDLDEEDDEDFDGEDFDEDSADDGSAEAA